MKKINIFIYLIVFIISLITINAYQDSNYEVYILHGSGVVSLDSNYDIMATEETNPLGEYYDSIFNIEEGFLFYIYDIPVTIISTGSGYMFQTVSLINFDITMQLKKKEKISLSIIDGIKTKFRNYYKQNEDIEFTIYITNKISTPVVSTELEYYLITPNGYTEQIENIELVTIPPSCPNARYDYKKDLCYNKKFAYFIPLRTQIDGIANLPKDALTQEWTLKTVLKKNTKQLATIDIDFDVKTKYNWIMISIIFIISVILITFLIIKIYDEYIY